MVVKPLPFLALSSPAVTHIPREVMPIPEMASETCEVNPPCTVAYQYNSLALTASLYISETFAYFSITLLIHFYLAIN